MSFPRISISGTFILAVYITSIKYLFDNSLYGTSLRSTGIMSLESSSSSSSSSSSVLFNSFIMSTSFLNVASHSAVVLGALNDTYVLSILVGVGFDVITRILQLIWWIQITTTTIMISFRRQQETDINNSIIHINTNNNYYNTIILCSVLAIIYIYHMIIHVRALRMNYSYERLRSVLTGALNNLRGIPGDKFQDHIFAYTDLGSHLLPLCLSIILLQKQKALFTAFIILALLILISSFALSRIPFNNNNNNNNNNEVSNDSCDDIDEDSKSMNKFIHVCKDGSIACSCNACKKRSKRTNSQESSSFTFNFSDGICHLWLCSFENLSTFLSSYKSSSSAIHNKKTQ
jgi:multisubunit Na+/H+ antiporter MnhF subunit